MVWAYHYGERTARQAAQAITAVAALYKTDEQSWAEAKSSAISGMTDYIPQLQTFDPGPERFFRRVVPLVAKSAPTKDTLLKLISTVVKNRVTDLPC